MKIRTDDASNVIIEDKIFKRWKLLCIWDVRYARTDIFEMR